MILDMRCKIKLPVRFSDAPFFLELGSRFSIICFGKEVVVTDCQFCDPGRAKKDTHTRPWSSSCISQPQKLLTSFKQISKRGTWSVIHCSEFGCLIDPDAVAWIE